MPRTTLVTGVSRRRGIGFAVARRLLREDGGQVFVHSFAPYDTTEPWGADPGGMAGVLAGLGGEGDRLAHLEADLADPDTPRQLVAAAVDRFGPLDGLVANHARSQLGALQELDAGTLDMTWAVNVRASLLLVQAFAEQYRPRPAGGRVVLFTSGQHLGPAPSEIPYAATKGALQQITRTLADALAERDITVNCLNPGPTDTGWATSNQEEFVARHMPRGRWNSPDEAADVVALLLAPEAATITGQVVDAEGGFRRFTP
ncbi:MAG: SDR family oxidoreductase [Acidimicrobiales bacterium]